MESRPKKQTKNFKHGKLVLVKRRSFNVIINENATEKQIQEAIDV